MTYFSTEARVCSFRFTSCFTGNLESSDAKCRISSTERNSSFACAAVKRVSGACLFCKSSFCDGELAGCGGEAVCAPQTTTLQPKHITTDHFLTRFFKSILNLSKL